MELIEYFQNINLNKEQIEQLEQIEVTTNLLGYEIKWFDTVLNIYMYNNTGGFSVVKTYLNEKWQFFSQNKTAYEKIKKYFKERNSTSDLNIDDTINLIEKLI
ncbi:hypothetical protein D3C76_03640 [compost metagenome]